MSKSYGNTIDIFAPEKELKARIMGIVTDSTPVEAPKDPEASYIYKLYKLFASSSDAQVMAEKFRAGGMGYGDAKKALLSLLLDHFGKQRLIRAKIASDTGYVDSIRKKGAQKARDIGSITLAKVRNAVGVTFPGR
jgi:tryptophanyl-tRNA synthetase